MQVTLVGSPSQARAWRRAFADTSIEIITGDILYYAQGAAVVSPANSFGFMTGGLDLAIRHVYEKAGCDITALVQRVIRDEAHGELPVGQALVVPTPGYSADSYVALVVAPTMRLPHPVPWSLNAYLAFRAILWTTERWNIAHPDSPLDHLYCSGLATGIGLMSVRRSARQMRAAWDQVMCPPATISSLAARACQEMHW